MKQISTHLRPLDVSQQQPKGAGVLLQHVRLGYCTMEELYDGFHGQECDHCVRYNRHSLLHYLLSCTATADLKPVRPSPA
ncbi:hypothetical protein E2C01_030504 [Portunus trituberculatus]|uniref:Uncharacterized protein n=1 Tax=Portunus trituberculatus TaxID=210409 RepID=A0A5B7ER03_PORTR|nr:hypothetical protein [Portunus trituberculatus]